MPALAATPHRGRIAWLGRVPEATGGIRAEACDRLDLGWAGIPGDRHEGINRPSCSRVTQQHAKGTEIRNTRQLALVAEEEMAEIARAMGIERLDPRWLGASLVVAGIGDFSHLPPSARLQAPSGATLVVDMQNRPCALPGREIERDLPGQGARFRKAAEGLRGVTAWVERPGVLAIGDALSLHLPDQRAWRGGA
ncbi:MOSC domain-containing protein [Roseivivax sp. CAU 1761]